jgi:hypothetical protein
MSVNGENNVDMKVEPLPFTRRGRVYLWLLVLALGAIWLVSLYAFFTLPGEIPVHYGSSGTPTAYGGSVLFLLLPVVFSIVPVIFLVLARFRFVLINEYPYLLSLPAFYMNIGKVPAHKRTYWVNKYFELLSAIGAASGFFLLLLLLGIYRGALVGELPSWFTMAVLIVPVGIAVPFVYALRTLSKKMSADGNDDNIG